jgi:FMN phosphatase YigB (HAD superfamily)
MLFKEMLLIDKFKSSIINYLKQNTEIIWAFDLDDTITKTHESVLKYINSNNKTIKILQEKNLYPLKYEDISDFFFYKTIFGQELAEEIFSFENLYSDDLPLNDGFIEFYNFIVSHFGKNNIRIVTASFDGVENFKDLYLFKKLGISASQIIHAQEKHPHVKNTIYFDDGFHNLATVLDCENTLTICMKTPWNETERNNTEKLDYSISDFHEALDIFSSLTAYFPKK